MRLPDRLAVRPLIEEAAFARSPRPDDARRVRVYRIGALLR